MPDDAEPGVAHLRSATCIVRVVRLICFATATALLVAAVLQQLDAGARPGSDLAKGREASARSLLAARGAARGDALLRQPEGQQRRATAQRPPTAGSGGVRPRLNDTEPPSLPPPVELGRQCANATDCPCSQGACKCDLYPHLPPRLSRPSSQPPGGRSDAERARGAGAAASATPSDVPPLLPRRLDSGTAPAAAADGRAAALPPRAGPSGRAPTSAASAAAARLQPPAQPSLQKLCFCLCPSSREPQVGPERAPR